MIVKINEYKERVENIYFDNVGIDTETAFKLIDVNKYIDLYPNYSGIDNIHETTYRYRTRIQAYDDVNGFLGFINGLPSPIAIKSDNSGLNWSYYDNIDGIEDEVEFDDVDWITTIENYFNKRLHRLVKK